MATTHRARFLRLVTVDGAQIAPVPRLPRGWRVRQEREETLAIIHEHLGHLTHSMVDLTQSLGFMTRRVNRLKTLTKEMEASVGVSIPDFDPLPLPDHLA